MEQANKECMFEVTESLVIANRLLLLFITDIIQAIKTITIKRPIKARLTRVLF